MKDSNVKQIATGTVHKLPEDFKRAISSTKAVLTLWQDITPLARNEWICWVTSGKKADTRSIRIEKAIQNSNPACAGRAVGLGALTVRTIYKAL